MQLETRDLFQYLAKLPREPFALKGRIDNRRYLPREFPKHLPLKVALQRYPAYRLMVGENWMHWHDYYEVWVATGGHGEYRSGSNSFSFGPGDVVLVDPLKLHGVLRMEEAHSPLVFFFHPQAIAPTAAELDRNFLAAWDRRPDNILPRLNADDPITGPVHRAMLHLARTWFEPEKIDGRDVALKFYLFELLFHLRRAVVSRGETRAETVTMRSEREARLRRVLEYVSEHSHETISQPEVARAAGMSTSRFRAFFKETTGWGFGDYLRDLRLERAARLLRETPESVANVASVTGFADQSHLQRLFKAKYSISPLAYRKQHLDNTQLHEVSESFK